MAKRRKPPRRRTAPPPVPPVPDVPAVARPITTVPAWLGSVWLGGGVAVVVTFLVYVRNLAPSVTFEDSGELIAAAHGWGVPHAPGYPLYTMLAKLFTLVPLGTVAYRVNLMSACFSALAVGFVYLIVLRLLERIDGDPRPADAARAAASAFAVCGALLVGMAPAYFGQSVIAEVYALNSFFFGLLLWILLSWIADRRRHWFGVSCVVLGLALTNHHTAALFGPLILLVWVATEAEAVGRGQTWGGSCAVRPAARRSLALGCSPTSICICRSPPSGSR